MAMQAQNETQTMKIPIVLIAKDIGLPYWSCGEVRRGEMR